MKLNALHFASSSKRQGQQQGCQHQLRHSGHHASNDKETSMTAVKRLASHKAQRITFCLKLQAARLPAPASSLWPPCSNQRRDFNDRR
ncbi:hypothetical protein COP1_034435 [Malus domestica]